MVEMFLSRLCQQKHKTQPAGDNLKYKIYQNSVGLKAYFHDLLLPPLLCLCLGKFLFKCGTSSPQLETPGLNLQSFFASIPHICVI